MQTRTLIISAVVLFASCKSNIELNYDKPDAKVIFLHHSTGMNVYSGKRELLSYLSRKFEKYTVPRLIQNYNETNGKKYAIKEQSFPKGSPYGWNNYPFDYYNIWVKNAGQESYKDEPTLEILSKGYDVIIFKHCFPVSGIQEDDSISDINSYKKTYSNYVLQYKAIKQKLKEFSNTKFIVWTGAALTKNTTTEEEALRAEKFFDWVVNEWDEENDNIFIWDFRKLQTEDGLYFADDKAKKADDPHLSSEFSEIVAAEFAKKIIYVIEYDLENNIID